MKSFLRSFLFTLFFLTVVVVSFLSGYLVRDYRLIRQSTFPILFQAYDILLNHGYADPPPNPALEYGMIRGMISAYGDPYTSFAEPVQHELETNSIQGSFGGIGANLGNDSLGYYVLFPYPESPASKAGVQEGDRLIQVDDLVILPETSPDVIQAALRGPVGEEVLLRIAISPGYEEVLISITREEIPLPSVTWHLVPSDQRLGVIDLNIVADTTHDEILIAVHDLQARGATAFVLDLRDNFGGLLDAGIDIARLFLTSGVIIEQEYRGQSIQTFSVNSPGELVDLPLVIFINHNTASAAEIIAGTLQAHHRAILIGAPTFGKDTIQLVFELDDGSSLHVTAAHWWFPGLNNSIAPDGLLPDIAIELQDSSPYDPYITEALQYLFPSK
jgi:carboxyl-terminal processing protease